jgi:cell division septation protein DedD
VAQDDYYYEIQLTNKQLVFYFMAGATGLILSFLAGVMVGRSVEGTSEARTARAATEERVVTEETPRPMATPTTVDLTYAQRLESDRPEDALSGPPRPSASPTALPTPRPAATATPALTPPTPRPTPIPRPSPATVASTRPPATPQPTPEAGPATARDGKAGAARSAKATKPVPGTFATQVGAFKDRATADQIVGRLRGRGYEAFVVVDKSGLFNVRVGNFVARTDAERVQDRLRDEEKFKPFIVKQ